jgi:hypothetical protein
MLLHLCQRWNSHPRKLQAQQFSGASVINT